MWKSDVSILSEEEPGDQDAGGRKGQGASVAGRKKATYRSPTKGIVKLSGVPTTADAQPNMGRGTVSTPGFSRSGHALNNSEGEDVFASPVKPTGALKQMASLLDALPQTHRRYDEHSSDIEKEFERLLQEISDLLAAAVKEQAARGKRGRKFEDKGNFIVGLRWIEAGPEDPSGTEIKNIPLATALETKRQFSRAELESFQVSELSTDSYIKVRDVYFKPAGKRKEQASEVTDRKENEKREEPKPKIAPGKGHGLLENLLSKPTDYYGGRVSLNAKQLESGYHFLPDFMYREDDQGKEPVPVFRFSSVRETSSMSACMQSKTRAGTSFWESLQTHTQGLFGVCKHEHKYIHPKP
jgi:hypothetical protein